MAMIVKLIVASIFVLLCLCYIWSKNKKLDAPTVKCVPPNYVALEVVVSQSNGVLKYTFWESQITFYVDAEGTYVCIYQSNINDGDFIVKYEGNYYINSAILFDRYNTWTQKR